MFKKLSPVRSNTARLLQRRMILSHPFRMQAAGQRATVEDVGMLPARVS
ncbi:hypothetical protein ABZ070_16710 [Streptomyces sp. NPDC006283]